MSTFRVDEALSDYIVRSCTPPDPVVTSLIDPDRGCRTDHEHSVDRPYRWSSRRDGGHSRGGT